jgi:hypothetical protein
VTYPWQANIVAALKKSPPAFSKVYTVNLLYARIGSKGAAFELNT